MSPGEQNCSNWEPLCKEESNSRCTKSQRKEVSALGVAGTQPARCGGLKDVDYTSYSLSLLPAPAPRVFTPGYSESVAGLTENLYWVWQLALLGPCLLAQGWQPLLCGSLSLWVRLLCLTDQFPSCWAGKASFHLSHSSEVLAGSKQQKQTLVTTRKINHWLLGC